MTVNFVTRISRRERDQTGQVAWVPAWWGWTRAELKAAEKDYNEYCPDEEPDDDEPDWDEFEALYFGV